MKTISCLTNSYINWSIEKTHAIIKRNVLAVRLNYYVFMRTAHKGCLSRAHKTHLRYRTVPCYRPYVTRFCFSENFWHKITSQNISSVPAGYQRWAQPQHQHVELELAIYSIIFRLPTAPHFSWAVKTPHRAWHMGQVWSKPGHSLNYSVTGQSEAHSSINVLNYIFLKLQRFGESGTTASLQTAVSYHILFPLRLAPAGLLTETPNPNPHNVPTHTSHPRLCTCSENMHLPVFWISPPHLVRTNTFPDRLNAFSPPPYSWWLVLRGLNKRIHHPFPLISWSKPNLAEWLWLVTEATGLSPLNLLLENAIWRAGFALSWLISWLCAVPRPWGTGTVHAWERLPTMPDQGPSNPRPLQMLFKEPLVIQDNTFLTQL